MLCWTRTRCWFSTEASSVPMRCGFSSARVPASRFWVLQIILPCSDLSSLLPRLRPSAPSAAILPVSGSSASLSESGPLVANTCNFPAAEQLTYQTGLPPRHSLRYWWFPLGQREKRKSRLVLFGSLLGQACWLEKEKKGKEIIIHFFPLVLPLCFQIAKVKTECQHFLWALSSVTRERNPRWESAGAPCTLPVPLLNSQQCWPTAASSCNESPSHPRLQTAFGNISLMVCIVMS